MPFFITFSRFWENIVSVKRLKANIPQEPRVALLFHRVYHRFKKDFQTSIYGRKTIMNITNLLAYLLASMFANILVSAGVVRAMNL